jgi:hypothetical protein
MLWSDPTASDAEILRTSATDAPATFGDTFDAAWHDGQLFSSSVARGNAQMAGLDSYIDEVNQKSGQDIRRDVYGRLDMMNAANEAVAKIRKTNPDIQLPDLTDDELNKRAVAASSEAHQAATEMAGRDKTLGGKIGGVLGELASGTVDPINLVGMAVAPEAKLGIVATAAAWGGYGAASQSVNEVMNAGFRNQVEPGYTASDQPGMNVVESAVGGAALGGLFKGMGNVWSRMKTGEWPRSVRDAGNIVESEANIQQSNVLPGAEGEAAHREALGSAIDDIVASRSVAASESVSQVPAQQPGGIVAYHGSPYSFDAFSTAKIDTGEGAQAYGHGLYFAENESVARSYRDALTDSTIEGKKYDPYNALHVATAQVEESGSRAAAIKDIEKAVEHDPGDPSGHFPRVLAILKSDRELPKIDIGSGSLYQVRINADPEQMLDWDKPLSEQPQVQAALNAHYDKNGWEHEPDTKTGAEIYHESLKDAREYGGGNPTENATALFAEAGIPGIKYLDQGSRGAGDGTRNFVVFNEGDVQITHKNGEALSLFNSNEAKIDMMMDSRGTATTATAAAKQERATSTELPFGATVNEAKAELHSGTIADGLIRMGVPKDDAPALAARVVAAKTDDEARAILTEAMARPQTIGDTVPSVSEIAKAQRAVLEVAARPAPVARAPESIRASAVRVNGKIYEGPNHIIARDNASKATGLSIDEIIDLRENQELPDGFVTSTGRFVDRKTAQDIAEKADQLRAKSHWLIQENLKPATGELPFEATAQASADRWLADYNAARLAKERTKANIPAATVDHAAILADQNHVTAMSTDLERMRDTGQGGMIPMGVDEKGEPVMRLLDEALADAHNDRDAAEQLESCINPPMEEAAE